MVKLKDIGEHELLKIIYRYCDRRINGDDAAVINVPLGKQLVVTTDVLVENVHFSEQTTPPHAIGYRAATANLSDIAAMGGMPLGITVGLSLRPNLDIAWVEQLYQGLAECLQEYQVGILGGDVTRTKTNTIAITALGQVEPNRVIHRHTAQAGDSILVTGFHGLSKAGLEWLLHPENFPHLSPEEQKTIQQSHQYPQPRLDVIKCLQKYIYSPVAEESIIISGMDSSDGLADAIIQICQQSRVGAKIDLAQVKIPSELKRMSDAQTVLEWVLYGGEDFELVLCLPPEKARQLQQILPRDIQVIGEIKKDQNIQIVDRHNNSFKLLLNQNKTFQHF